MYLENESSGFEADLSNIFTKLHVPGRAAAVVFALRQGLF